MGLAVDLSGKKALVTGGSRGIGASISKVLASCGAYVYVAYSRDEEGARSVSSEIGSSLSEPLRLDVSNYDGVFSALKGMDVDILINNAGISIDGIFLRLSKESIDRVISTNLLGAMWVTKALLRGMLKKRWGRVVNISSIVGITGNAGQIPYAASKAGIIAFTKSLAKEVSGRGITVNCVAPGFIETKMTEVFSEEEKKSILSQIPCGRLGKPEDVAWVVAFLCSDYASYINGEVINVSGGLYM